VGLQALATGSLVAQEGGSALEMDGSKEQPQMTAGLDLGDKYSYLCLIDTESGEVMEEGRLRTAPEALRRRFSSEQQPLRIAIARQALTRPGLAGCSRSVATRSW
jgi:hypothetical protein